MTEAERKQSLEAMGWRTSDAWRPSVADAWAYHKLGDVPEQLQAARVVRIDLGLPADEAQALAQFANRLSWEAIRECALDDAECYRIRAAMDRVRHALAAPR